MKVRGLTVYLWFNQWYELGGNAPWTETLVAGLEEVVYGPLGLA